MKLQKCGYRMEKSGPCVVMNDQLRTVKHCTGFDDFILPPFDSQPE